MGGHAVRARHISDQSDCLQNAFRSCQRRVRRLRRVLHRDSIAARRIIPALAAVIVFLFLSLLVFTLFRLSPTPLRLRFGGRGRSPWMGDRAVYCARLESVCAERHRGFESPPIRHPASCCALRRINYVPGTRFSSHRSEEHTSEL